MRKAFILLLAVITKLTVSQIYQPILFPEKVDKKYIFNTLKEQEKYEKKIKKTLSGQHLKDYSYNAVSAKTNLFSNGNIYLNWQAMESYINQILDSIIPANLASKKIKAFVGRSSDLNAYCLYDGTMIVNVGLIAEVKNEAALAAVMGHELGHFIKNHLLTQYKSSLKKKRSKGLDAELQDKKFSQDHELEADKEGFAIALAAGYDLEEANSNFELFIREQEYYKKRNASDLANTDSVTITTKKGKYNANTLEKLLSTHPDMKDRQSRLREYIKSNKATRKVKFKMDEDLFFALQQQARLESVNLLFNSHNYSECLERAFIYHLFEPSNINYSYFTAECIRRNCLLNYKLRKKGFLAEKLSNQGFSGNKGILHDLRYLIPNQQLYSKINAKQFLDTNKIAFETYQQAFYYFTDNLAAGKYNEAYLMKALFENNKAKIKTNVDKYLASGKVKHRNYATHYMNNSLSTEVDKNTQEIVMVPKVYFYRQDKYGKKYLYYRKTEVSGNELANEITSAMSEKLTDTKVISLPLATTENFNTKHKYESILASCFLAQREENEGYEVVHYYKHLEDEDYVGKVDLFRLDPDIWEFFMENKINTISYALFNRDKSDGDKSLRNTLIGIGVFAWPLLPFAIIYPVNYKTIYLYSYNSRLGRLYYDYHSKSRRINGSKGLNLFKTAKKSRDKFITSQTIQS